MRGSIAIDKDHGKPWTVSVRLPLTFIRQFAHESRVIVADKALCSAWGDPYFRESIMTNLRTISRQAENFVEAEALARRFCGEITRAVKALREVYHKEYPVVLEEEEAPIVVQEATPEERQAFLNEMEED